MKLRTKLTIFVAAVMLTFIGFNLMVSPAGVELVQLGKDAKYEIISNFLARTEAAAHQSKNIKG